MRSGTYITVVIIAGFCLVAYLFSAAPEAAPTQLPLILAGIGGLVAVLAKLGDTDGKVETATGVSQSNASRLAQQAQEIAANTAVTETTHNIVNSQRTEMLSELATLRGEIAALKQERTRTVTAQTHADQTEARLMTAIAAGPVQAIPEAVERVLDEKVVPIVQTEVQRVVEEHKEEGH